METLLMKGKPVADAYRETVSAKITAAKEKGIKTISYDRLILNGDTDLYVSFNNKAVGTLMGKELKRDLPDGGQIIMIQGVFASMMETAM